MELPNQWRARSYQRPFIQYMLKGGMEEKRACCVWHRRSGKDSTCLNLAAVASQLRVGTIWHMLPELAQGRKVIWDGIDGEGRRMIDQAFHPDMREGDPNQTEMKIRFKNGSYYQVVGSDNFNSIIGTNPIGVIFSEYAVADPEAWDFIRPILAENRGWAVFEYTPRGKNHGFSMKKMAETNPKWFYSLLTVDDTKRDDGTSVIAPQTIDEERRSGMSEEKIQQEYYCSFDGGMNGSYYTNEIQAAERDGRINDFPHDPSKQCQTWWDIGWRDDTSILVTQRNPYGKPDIIDYLTGRNRAVGDWIRDLRNLPYDYDEHWGPHDLENHDWTTGKTRREFAAGLGFNFDIVPKIPVSEGIDATRAMLRVARFNRPRTQRLIDALLSYHREYDSERKIFGDRPYHDWSSHGSDGMRHLATGWRDYGGIHRIQVNRFRVKRAVGDIVHGRE